MRAAPSLLLVEDNPADAEFTERQLGELAGAVTRAGTLASALEAAQNRSFDLVLLDLNLPDSNGLESLLRFRDRRPDAAVVVLTCGAGDGLRQALLGAGARDYVAKTDIQRLLGCVRGVLAARPSAKSDGEPERLDEERALAKKLEGIGQFAALVAHDFNNLLTVMISHAEFLAESLPDGGLEKTDVREILAASARARDLTKKLVALSRPEPWRPELVSLGDLVSGFCAVGAVRLPGHIELALAPVSERQLVEVDPTHLDRLLGVLADNAVDAMPDGGTIRIGIETMRVTRTDDVVAPGDYACLVVSDTGPGVPNELKERIFEPFFTTKQPNTGRGMGLAEAYCSVHRAGGAIRVGDAPGGGAVFTVRLPRVRPRVPLRLAKPAPLPRGRRPR